ncbi:MAG: hypothetical protein RBS43_08040 [Candidatus Cloacimonas sp.]|nr:hypothetical protein [Candidatus Cloacimonas sp.]
MGFPKSGTPDLSGWFCHIYVAVKVAYIPEAEAYGTLKHAEPTG